MSASEFIKKEEFSYKGCELGSSSSLIYIFSTFDSLLKTMACGCYRERRTESNYTPAKTLLGNASYRRDSPAAPS